jgi:hypothetical protein
MIYVFKTSVRTKTQVKKLKPQINELLPPEKWNFDLADCDRILRIDIEESMALKIAGVLTNNGFNCEELE